MSQWLFLEMHIFPTTGSMSSPISTPTSPSMSSHQGSRCYLWASCFHQSYQTAEGLSVKGYNSDISSLKPTLREQLPINFLHLKIQTSLSGAVIDSFSKRLLSSRMHSCVQVHPHGDDNSAAHRACLQRASHLWGELDTNIWKSLLDFF